MECRERRKREIQRRQRPKGMLLLCWFHCGLLKQNPSGRPDRNLTKCVSEVSTLRTVDGILIHWFLPTSDRRLPRGVVDSHLHFWVLLSYLLLEGHPTDFPTWLSDNSPRSEGRRERQSSRDSRLGTAGCLSNCWR